MLRALPHLLGFLMPVAIVLSVRAGGFWTFLPTALALTFLPVADALAGLNLANADPEEQLENNRWFRLITWAWVPTQVGLLAWILGRAENGLSPVEIAGVAISTGITTGTIGITFAHELIHRPGRLELALGEILLATTSYTHFAIEHVYGHHRYVATPRDPATARFGESLFAFIPRCVGGSLVSAWRIECARLSKRGRPWWHPSNRMLRYGLTQVAMYAAAVAVWGWLAAVVLGTQAAVAFSLLETINYIEHYGLERREIAPGRYERVQPWHSWNSSHRLSNWLLINLARHSDHHLVASKRYQVLDHVAIAPQLPAGYAAMFLLAMCPPLWRRVMDPRVRALRSSRL